MILFLGLFAMLLSGVFIGWICGWDAGRRAECSVWLLADSKGQLQGHATITRLNRIECPR